MNYYSTKYTNILQIILHITSSLKTVESKRINLNSDSKKCIQNHLS